MKRKGPWASSKHSLCHKMFVKRGGAWESSKHSLGTSYRNSQAEAEPTKQKWMEENKHTIITQGYLHNRILDYKKKVATSNQP